MLHFQFTPFPVLHTARLTLRPLTEADAPAIRFFRSDDEFLRYIPREKEPTLQQARQHLALLQELQLTSEAITWGLSRRAEPSVLVGTVCLWHLQPAHHRAEIGYGLLPQYAKQGLMAEAVRAVVDYAFTQARLHSLEAQVDPANEASVQLLEKQGFVREGLLRENYHFQGRFFDTAVYSLLTPHPD